ncbi:MAG: HNH endonuclease [Muribaculaceae bacterium]|nr:HNH endonuclease [Muribaculaceae bacterium]
MKIEGHNFNFVDTLNSPITVPDCFVMRASKIGGGNGEAKLYIAPKTIMYPFFGNEGFVAKCFLLKSDLLSYMNALHAEYMHPSQDYRGAAVMPRLWKERVAKIEKLPEVIEFNVTAQDQIEGARGYVNSKDPGYQLIREISLPLVSYISVMQLTDSSGATLYYWKLFADFEAISDKREALVFTYGKKGVEMPIPEPKISSRQKEIRKARQGQGIYRDKLLSECPFCPITMINDERLLIASHIKPWAVANDIERLDPKNGLMLSPLYDKLFDRGLMTFTEDRRIVLSNWISPMNKARLGVKDGQFIQLLPLDTARQSYLQFHRSSVFKG